LFCFISLLGHTVWCIQSSSCQASEKLRAVQKQASPLFLLSEFQAYAQPFVCYLGN